MQINTYIIDTFTSTPFKGNPTGICYLREMINDTAMQAIAGELNFPVSGFIQLMRGQEYSIRYFTPITEIPACGHATLAAARTAAIEDNAATATFYTSSGIALTTTMNGNTVMMTYPKYAMQPFNVTDEILGSLQLQEFISAGYSPELETLFIETDAATLRSVQPDYRRMERSSEEIKEIVLTSSSGTNGYDYLLRSFCPWIGIDEDPVTGSVHTVLSGFWKDRLHKSNLKAYQASARGGDLLVNAFDDKTEIGGETVVLLKGTITL